MPKSADPTKERVLLNLALSNTPHPEVYIVLHVNDVCSNMYLYTSRRTLVLELTEQRELVVCRPCRLTR